LVEDSLDELAGGLNIGQENECFFVGQLATPLAGLDGAGIGLVELFPDRLKEVLGVLLIFPVGMNGCAVFEPGSEVLVMREILE